jgi:hypothetical protein
MPKGDRQRSVRTSNTYYNLSPQAQHIQPQTQAYDASSQRPLIQDTYYSVPLANNLSQQSYTQTPTQYPTNAGGPVQPLHHQPSHSPYTMPQAAPLSSIRPSSGAWNPTDDQTLMAARAQGMNWQPIQQSYFPSKTPNACRNRHERLMERRSADDWDSIRLETLAKNYMGMRREIWQGLAAQTGEKWNVVEHKVCFLFLTPKIHMLTSD